MRSTHFALGFSRRNTELVEKKPLFILIFHIIESKVIYFAISL